MKYRGRLKSVEEFQNTVLRAEDDGSTLRLKDVAKVELGALSYSFHGKTNGHPGVTFMAFQVAGANATSVNEAITDKLNEMSKDLPAGTEFLSMMSSNDFLFASIHNVVETLVIAIILVILVVYFFLQDFKRHADTVYFHHCLFGRYVRLSDGSRIQYQHSYAFRFGACHRYGS